ncbi:MAG: S-ribosylhomocysteine lyase [Clostridia bacterium]|nr:S-ribosylhomocysteine lyase [Clostridia bacterium]
MNTLQTNPPKQIASFSVDHDFIKEGIYVSRIDGDVTTYDLRTRIPNGGDYLDDVTMHSVEHMLTTFLRSSAISDSIIYFGPMGCRTGFYLLVRNADNNVVLSELKLALKNTIEYQGEIFGGTRKECGNYKCLSLESAKKECERYLNILNNKTITFKY